MFTTDLRTMIPLALATLALCASALPLRVFAADLPGPASKRLSLEGLYGLPRLIGSAPKAFAWSGNGKRLAFLWNDEGRNFYDVWILDVDQAKPRRASALPRRSVDAGISDPIARREAEVAVEQEEGVTAVTWHPNG